MSKSNTFENDLLKLIFQNTNIADLGDATGVRGSTTVGNLYVSLHTAALDDTSVQNTSETSYQNYTRVPVTRTSGGWTVTNNTVNPTAAISFPTAGASGGATMTWFAVGLAASGATDILYKGTISPSIVVSEGVTPQLTTATAITED